MSLRSISLVALSCISLIACSSAPIDPTELAGKLKDRLTTDIKADGLKLFIYQANLIDEASIRDNTERPFPHEDRMRQKSQDPQELRRSYKEKEAILEIWGAAGRTWPHKNVRNDRLLPRRILRIKSYDRVWAR